MAEQKVLDKLNKEGKKVPPNKLKYVTKRGNYLDDEIKLKPSKIVSPSTYIITDIWVQIF
jgi:hypothetical protein